jgi:P-type Cu+ transporter
MRAATASPIPPSSPSAPAACRHCGDPCRTPIVTEDGTFCCTGCEAVFRILAAHDLGAFYACEIAPGVSQADAGTRDGGRFALLDDPAVAARFVHGAGQRDAIATFVLPALHCASCVWLLEQLYRFGSGIGRSEVDLLQRTLRVHFSPAVISVRALAERIAALGYEPLLDAERPAAEIPQSRRDLYLKIGVAGFAFGNVMLFSIPQYANGGPLDPEFQRLFNTLNLLFAVPVLVYSAADYFRGAWNAIRGRTMVLDVPIALGLVALFGRSVVDIAGGRGEGFLDSFAGLVFFLLIGRLFQQKAFEAIAFDRTMRSFFPLSVRVERNGTSEMTALEALRPGDVMALRPHEVVPADATLLDDRADLDYAFVTGESAPQEVRGGAAVAAGGRVIGRTLRAAVIRPVSHSRLAALWNHPVFARPKARWLTTVTARFGWWFTAGAVLLAVAGALAWWPDVAMALQVATAVLIIACPCALTLAAPIALGTAMGRLGTRGCYLKHPAVVLDLGRINAIAFDKTGTLTSASGDVQVRTAGLTAEDWCKVQRLAGESVHPISRAISGRGELVGQVSDVREAPGCGLTGCVDGTRVVIGRASFVATEAARLLPAGDDRTWAVVGDRAPGWISVEIEARPGITDAIRRLASRYRVWLLSGDAAHERSRWERLFGRQLRFRLSPEAKLAALSEHQAAATRVLMVGDGLNDAAALAGADVGLAVSDDTACLVPACDGVVRGERLQYLPEFLGYARLARRVIALCFVVSIVYNVLGLGLALAGRLTPLATAILMPLSSMTVIGLAAGLMRRAARELPA